MKPSICTRLFFTLTAIIISVSLQGQVKGFEKIRWEKEKIAPGLVWKSAHTIIDDTIPQNINILIADTRRRDISLLYNPGKNIKTSIQASGAGALAAVNAGFFNVKDGGSATYIKVNGLIVDSDTSKKWKRAVNMNGSVIVDTDGNVSISGALQNNVFDENEAYRDVLITGPVLVHGKQRANLPNTSLVIARHPRTCAGTRGKHKVIFLTIDGRTDQSYGMTLLQLADLMVLLKCDEAVNLDGGGSTTMYISGKPYNGIVNMPCDNKKFDHEGERAVSNLFIIK